MTYEEYANTHLENGGMSCRLPHQLTIRGWAEDWLSNQLDDNREPKDASQITGTATLIYSSYHEGGWARFDGVVRCGDYIYIPEWERVPEYDWWYYIDHQDIANDSTYYAHVIEYCISTGETVDINLGVGDTGTGPWSQICVVEERKILYYEYDLDELIIPGGHYIRIVDFSTQTVKEILWIEDDVTPTFWRSIQDIAVIRDINNQIHLLVMCIFGDDSKKYAGPNGNNILGATGFTIYHKNYTIDSQWQVLDVPIDSQDTDIGAWDRAFDIVDNRYLVIFGFRDEPGGYGPIYLVHVVFDVITCAPPVEYDLQSPWGEDWWDSPIVTFSSPDFTNGKLYEAISQYPEEDDIVDMSFNPVTGEFIQGTIFVNYPPYWIFYPFSSREHTYFWNDENNNFYLGSTDEILGNYSVEYKDITATSPHDSKEGLNISNLLDSNNGENPLLWFWSYNDNTLKAIDVITGNTVFNMLPTGFTQLNGYTVYVLHMGDSILLATDNEVLYPHGSPPTSWNVGCTQIDYYLIT